MLITAYIIVVVLLFVGIIKSMKEKSDKYRFYKIDGIEIFCLLAFCTLWPIGIPLMLVVWLCEKIANYINK